MKNQLVEKVLAFVEAMFKEETEVEAGKLLGKT